MSTIRYGRQRSPEKNAKSKTRNAARRQYRKDNPQHRGKQLHCWPLPQA